MKTLNVHYLYKLYKYDIEIIITFIHEMFVNNCIIIHLTSNYLTQNTTYNSRKKFLKTILSLKRFRIKKRTDYFFVSF